MKVPIIVAIVMVVLALLGLALACRIVKQYEQGVLFRFGRVQGPRAPGVRLIIPFADVLRRVSLRIVPMPIQSQGIIIRDNDNDNVDVDVSAVAYCRVAGREQAAAAMLPPAAGGKRSPRSQPSADPYRTEVSGPSSCCPASGHSASVPLFNLSVPRRRHETQNL